MSSEYRVVKPEEDSDSEGFKYVRKTREKEPGDVTVNLPTKLNSTAIAIIVAWIIAGIGGWMNLKTEVNNHAQLLLQQDKAMSSHEKAISDAAAENTRRYEKLDEKLDRMMKIIIEKNP